MSIKRFLIIVFTVLIIVAIYVNIRYLNGVEIEKNTQPIENFNIIEVRCHNSSKMTNIMIIKYRGIKYSIELYGGDLCSDIESGIIKPKLYYIKDKDVIFYEGQYVPFPYVYLTYIAAFLIPLLGFIAYRKELNNHYKTM